MICCNLNLRYIQFIYVYSRYFRLLRRFFFSEYINCFYSNTTFISNKTEEDLTQIFATNALF